MTTYAGALLPCVIATTSGRAAGDREVQVLDPDTLQPAPVYLDRERTPAPGPLKTDAAGNFGGYFAEVGYYKIKASDLPIVDTIAVIDPEEAVANSNRPGPQGPQGSKGDSAPKRWTGHGPPALVIGASPQDEYLDVDTGDLYRLD